MVIPDQLDPSDAEVDGRAPGNPKEMVDETLEVLTPGETVEPLYLAAGAAYLSVKQAAKGEEARLKDLTSDEITGFLKA